MVASGADGSNSRQNGRRIEALRDIKETEQAVEDEKQAAREQAEQTVEHARRKANKILDDTIEEAERETDERVQQAREGAQQRADEILADAEREAQDLRNVSDTQLDDAVEAVIEEFKARIGGS